MLSLFAESFEYCHMAMAHLPKLPAGNAWYVCYDPFVENLFHIFRHNWTQDY